VMREGRLAATMDRLEATEESIMAAGIGQATPLATAKAPNTS
jgi:hypothetical protein